MWYDFKLNNNWDIDDQTIGTKKSVKMITDGGEWIVQKIAIVLYTLYKEVYTNYSIGVGWYEDILGQKPQQYDVDAEIKLEILGVEGVEKITEYRTSFNPITRKYDVYFTVETVYGTVNSTIPLGVSL